MKKIQLTKGQFALVDDADFEELSKYKWYAHKAKNYAGRSLCKKGEKRVLVLMHRQILDIVHLKSVYCDHINGNGLDNRRINLRVCSNSENLRNRPKQKNNTSGFKGVRWRGDMTKWTAEIRFSGKRVYLGGFALIEDAARAYDEAAKKYHGEFARTNF